MLQKGEQRQLASLLATNPDAMATMSVGGRPQTGATAGPDNRSLAGSASTMGATTLDRRFSLPSESGLGASRAGSKRVTFSAAGFRRPSTGTFSGYYDERPRSILRSSSAAGFRPGTGAGEGRLAGTVNILTVIEDDEPRVAAPGQVRPAPADDSPTHGRKFVVSSSRPSAARPPTAPRGAPAGATGASIFLDDSDSYSSDFDDDVGNKAQATASTGKEPETFAGGSSTVGSGFTSTVHPQTKHVNVPKAQRESAGGIEHWQRGDLLGSGSYGQVFSALNLVTGATIAVKQVKLAEHAGRDKEVRCRQALCMCAMRCNLVDDELVTGCGSRTRNSSPA